MNGHYMDHSEYSVRPYMANCHSPLMRYYLGEGSLSILVILWSVDHSRPRVEWAKYSVRIQTIRNDCSSKGPKCGGRRASAYIRRRRSYHQPIECGETLKWTHTYTHTQVCANKHLLIKGHFRLYWASNVMLLFYRVLLLPPFQCLLLHYYWPIVGCTQMWPQVSRTTGRVVGRARTRDRDRRGPAWVDPVRLFDRSRSR